MTRFWILRWLWNCLIGIFYRYLNIQNWKLIGQDKCKKPVASIRFKVWIQRWMEIKKRNENIKKRICVLCIMPQFWGFDIFSTWKYVYFLIYNSSSNSSSFLIGVYYKVWDIYIYIYWYLSICLSIIHHPSIICEY